MSKRQLIVVQDDKPHNLLTGLEVIKKRVCVKLNTCKTINNILNKQMNTKLVVHRLFRAWIATKFLVY